MGIFFRSNPSFKLVKKFLNNNSIGKIIEADFYCGSWLPDWRSVDDYRNTVSAKKNLGGGVLLELSHEIDLALKLFGKIDILNSHIINSGILEIDTEDLAYLNGQNDKKTLISLRLNFCTKIPRRKLIIRGTRGEISWNLLNGKVVIQKSSKNIEVHECKKSKEEIFALQLETFFQISNVYNSELCNVQEGLEVLNIIEKSLKINKKIF